MSLPPITKGIFEVYEKPGQKRNRGDVSKTTTGFLCCKKVHYTDTGSHLYSKKISFVEIMHRLSSELDNPALKLKADSYKNLYQIVDYMKGQKTAHIEYKNEKHPKFANFMTKLRAFFSKLQNQWNGFGKETSLKIAEEVLVKLQALEQKAKGQNPPVPQAPLPVEEVPFAPVQAAVVPVVQVDVLPPAYAQPSVEPLAQLPPPVYLNYPAPPPMPQDAAPVVLNDELPVVHLNYPAPPQIAQAQAVVLNDSPPNYVLHNNDRFAQFGLSNDELLDIKKKVNAEIPQEIQGDSEFIKVFHSEAVEIGRKLLNKLMKLPNIKPLNDGTLQNYTRAYCDDFLKSKSGKRFLVRKSSTQENAPPYIYFAVSKRDPHENDTKHALIKFNTETKKWSYEIDVVQHDSFYSLIKATCLDNGYKSISVPDAQEVESYIKTTYSRV